MLNNNQLGQPQYMACHVVMHTAQLPPLLSKLSKKPVNPSAKCGSLGSSHIITTTPPQLHHNFIVETTTTLCEFHHSLITTTCGVFCGVFALVKFTTYTFLSAEY